MPTLKEQFYEIANCHNRITVPAGCIKEILKMNKPLTKLNIKGLNTNREKLISIFDRIEKAALDADKKIMELKNYIYKTTSPEASF